MPSLSKEEIARYSRHLLLPGFGLEAQERLKGGSVLCIGAGGLGSPLLLYLAAAGVGRIGIVDNDVVDLSNLQRQVLHGAASVGTPKVQSAETRIKDLNPNVQVEPHNERLTVSNVLGLISQYDVVVDGSDNFATRYLVNDACVLLGKPLVYGSILRFEGQASVFNYKGGPNYRDLYPEPPPEGSSPNCAESGVLGVLPGIIGTIQATETLKILTGIGNPLSGRLLLYNALNMEFRELQFSADPDQQPITELTDYAQSCAVAERFSRISVDEFRERWSQGWRPFVLDVREQAEVQLNSFPHTSMARPLAEVDEIPAHLLSNSNIVVVCRSGGRSAKAAQRLIDRGFTGISNLEGGVLAWVGK